MPDRSVAEQHALVLLLRAIREALYETTEPKLIPDETARAIRSALAGDERRRVLRPH